jgi:hypothetical protein
MNEDGEYQKDTLEVADIKRILGCGINQAYKLVNSGAFHTIRIGTRIKIPKESFYSWYRGQEQGHVKGQD